MTYYDLRKKFVELSGRYDLINSDYTDCGADFFINAGQKMLDRMQDMGKMQARNVQSIVAGTSIVQVADLRAIREVWIGTTTDGLIRLGKASLSWLRQNYEMQLSSVTQGQPEYYAPVSFRPYPDAQTALGWSGYYDIADLLLGSTHFGYTGIVIAPPPDKTYYVSIDALYYSPTLSATLLAGVWTQTKSFWTEVHPDILLQAALYKLETFYRNREGAKDWKDGLDFDLFGMDKDLAEEEAVDISEMGG